jgi:hypothetical protein
MEREMDAELHFHIEAYAMDLMRCGARSWLSSGLPALRLTATPGGRYRRYMAQSILVFDFGTNEEAAQKARHKIEGWKQAFRLNKKVLLKFEREEEEKKDGSGEKNLAEEKPAEKKKPSASKENDEKPQPSGHIHLFIRLDFSDHEKLSHNRWLARIAAEEPFKSVKAEVVHSGDEAFAKTSDLFDSLD